MAKSSQAHARAGAIATERARRLGFKHVYLPWLAATKAFMIFGPMIFSQ